MVDASTRTALYRLYDAGGQLLYVGITTRPRYRWTEHARDKQWWPQVVNKTIEWHEDRSQALAAESAAIAEERPIHNRTHNLQAQAEEAHRWREAAEQRDAEFEAAKQALKATSGFASMTYSEWLIAAAEIIGDESRAAYWRRIKAKVDEAPPLTRCQKDRLRILLTPVPSDARTTS
ncbi:GIY-YIG nuclease family protein [Kitasatospora sp. NPDC001660]